MSFGMRDEVEWLAPADIPAAVPVDVPPEVLRMPRSPTPDAVAIPWQATGVLDGPVEDERARRRAEDARLVLRTRNGDEDAFRRLVERYQRKVYWIAYDILLDGEEARDVAQETFLRVHGALASFDTTRDFLNWIYRITRNLAIDAFRRRRRRAVPVEDLTGLPESDADAVGRSSGERDSSTSMGGQDLRERVAVILAELPVEYRLALTLREYHNLAPREIAALTDCTYPTARWRLHRARTLFRKAWEKRFGAAGEEGVA